FSRDRGGSIVDIQSIHHPVGVIDTLPIPDRSGFDHARYQEFWRETAGCRMTSIMVTRGCPFSCDFCSRPVWGSVFRKPDLDRVFREIEDIIRYGYDTLWIADDSFTLDTNYLKDFCARMIRSGTPLRWTCLSRVDRLTPALVALMHEAGCIRVYLGLESGNDETLRLMGKRSTVADGIRAVRLFRDAGIGTSGFFMVGYPGETVASIESTLDLAVSLPLDEISINVPFPLPGSPLFSRIPGLDPDADWDVSNEAKFVYRSEFDEEWIRGKIARAREDFARRKREREG
ncbi:MAG: radical SAM protein, partial [Methanoregulaceae archaeon]|nr:radical SAM protein [Methanoregulaceae archaeon]